MVSIIPGWKNIVFRLMIHHYSIVIYYARVRSLHVASMNTSANRPFVSVVKQPGCTIDMTHNNINITVATKVRWSMVSNSIPHFPEFDVYWDSSSASLTKMDVPVPKYNCYGCY